MVYVTNDVVDLLPTAMVLKVNVLHCFLPIISMVCVCLRQLLHFGTDVSIYRYIYSVKHAGKQGFLRALIRAYACGH